MTSQKPTELESLIGGGILLIILLIVGSLSNCDFNKETPEQIAEREAKAQKEKVKKEKEMVDGWFAGGSELSCEDNLKEKLRDPDSYQRNGDFLVVKNTGSEKTYNWRFRSRNGFGGYSNGIGMCIVTKNNGGTVNATMLE